jgi:hypothetical protein
MEARAARDGYLVHLTRCSRLLIDQLSSTFFSVSLSSSLSSLG